MAVTRSHCTLMQLTYEGLLDEVFGLSCGQMKADAPSQAAAMPQDGALSALGDIAGPAAARLPRASAALSAHIPSFCCFAAS